MKIKIITALTAEVTEGEFHGNQGVLQQVIEQPAKGFFRSTKLGRDGLVFKRADLQLAIPLEVLWKMVETVEPGFHPPALQPGQEVTPAAATPTT